MARVEIYEGHSSIVPVLFATYDSQWKSSFLDGIKIKQEPLGSDASDNEHVDHDASNDEATTTRDSQIIHHVNEEEVIRNHIIPSNENYTTEGSSSTCLNIDENHVDDPKTIDYDNTELKNTIASPSHVESGNDVINRRLRTRTKSSSLLECDICYATFIEENLLKAHKNYYNRHRLMCRPCGRHFSTPIGLTSHRRSVHRGDDWSRFKYECHYCKLGFVSKHYLQQHIFHYHNINHRIKYRNTSQKTRVDSNSHDPQWSKRKSDDKAIVGPLRKKLAMRKKHDEIDVPFEVDNVENKQFNIDDQTNNIVLPQPSISDNQNNNSNNINSNHNVQSNPSVQRPLVQICVIPNEVENLLNDCEQSDDDISSYSDFSGSYSDSEMSDTPCSPIRTYSLRSTSGRLSNFWTPNRSTQRKWAILQKRFKCRNCHVRLERVSLPLPVNSELTHDFSDIDNTKEDNAVLINSRPTVGMELKNLELAMKKLQDVNQGPEKIPVEDEPSSLEDLQSSSESENAVPTPPEGIPINTLSASRMLYISSLCQTRYTTKKKLVYHYLCFHTNPRYQECAVCRSQCENLSDLTEHLMQHCIEIPESLHEKSPIDPKESCENSQEKYMCKGCKKKFWLVSYLKDHERLCEKVRESRSTNSPNNQDIEKNIANEPWPRSILHARLSLNCSNDDSDTQSTQKPDDGQSILLVCTVCHTTFKNKTKYLEHKKKYSSSMGKYYCHRCGTPFPSPSLLGAHTRTAHDQESSMNNVCVICEQAFRENSYLRQHMLHIHNDELNSDPLSKIQRPEQTYEKTCRICKIIFPDRKSYVEHAMYYYDDNIVKCSTCHETFSSQCKVLNHKKKSHDTEEKQQDHIYCCNICNEGFIYPTDLFSHMYHVHDTSFQSDQSMSKDENKQDTDRRGVLYMCRVCDETFSTAVLLTDHQSEYSDTGSHKCYLCTRNCKTRSLLEKHIKLTHNGPPRGDQIKCHSCNEILATKASWHCHLKHFHIISVVNERSPRIRANGIYPLSKSPKQSDIVNETENNSDPRTSHPIKIEYTCALCDMQFMNSIDLKTHSLKYGNMCIHNSDIINTNFSIDSIYSVKLEDYEKLSNAKDDGINVIKMDGPNRISEIKDTYTECGKIDDTRKRSVKKSLEILNSYFECDICLTNFPSRRALTKHKTRYSNTGDHECTICQRKFLNIRHYKDHEKKHESRKREIQKCGVEPSHYCKTCDEKFASENSKKFHFAHIHGELLKSRQSPGYDTERRKSTRQQSKLMYQTNLDTFVTRDSNDEKSEKLNETFGDIGTESTPNTSSIVDTNIGERTNMNTVTEPGPSQATLNNIEEDGFTTIEHSQKTSNSSSVIVRDEMANESMKNMKEVEEIQKEIVEVIREEKEVQNEIVETDNDVIVVENVVAEQEIEIVVEEEEIIEVEDVSTSANTTRGLCDICGDVFSDRSELINHQKNVHDTELVIDTLSDMQEEFIDIELISDDEVQYESSKNSDKKDLDIIYDSTSVRDYRGVYPTTRPPKPRTFTKRNLLKCGICHSPFSSINLLGKHLEIHHPTDSLPKKVDNIQNPCVSSSSKICDPKRRNAHLCCKFCGKQFLNESYLDTHMKNVHKYEVDVTAAPQQKLGASSNDYSSVKNTIDIDNTQSNSRSERYIFPRSSKVTIVKNTEGIKKLDGTTILCKIAKSDINVIENSINRNSARFTRLIPISPTLIRTLKDRLIIPTTNQLQNNNMSQ